ncbi:hypothetical protein [Melittangium boletus]|uniref:hypothetical protein n=1 Tax=Melittangium boletus TaxID=83453 RepID=UPI003DA3F81B
MALGQELVRNLELDARGTIPERWLAHHLAELMVEAERATGPAKAEAEARATDLILRLWAKRRDLPAAADPLGGYREAIAVLSRLMPDRNPWAAYDHHGGPEQMFHDLFDCMARVVMCGLLLTEARPPREVAPAEEAAMEREELALREHLNWWAKAIGPSLPVVVQRLVGPDDHLAVLATDSAEDGELPAAAALGPTGGQHPDQSDEDRVEPESDEEEEFDGADDGNEADDASGDLAKLRLSAHETVTAALESLQRELATLVERWRANSLDPKSRPEGQ